MEKRANRDRAMNGEILVMERISVLVVDDSSFMRRAIKDIIERDPAFRVIGTARDGKDAIQKVARFRPDLVTMDIEMPEMNGVEAIGEIMRTTAVPVVIISMLTRDGAAATLDAFQAGAVDVFLKDDVLRLEGRSKEEFYLRLKAAARANLGRVRPLEQPNHSYALAEDAKSDKAAIVVIGCSTGGPAALQAILPKFDGPLPVPLVVVQHMPVGFTSYLAERLDRLCSFRVKEAEDGEPLRPGVVYIAPAGMQTVLNRDDGGEVHFQVRESLRNESFYNPSVDVTLSSAARVYGDRTLAVILTGMGKDGLRGCEQVKQRGGRVIVESEQSCVVYGMPKAVYERGYADLQVPLEQIRRHILRRVGCACAHGKES